MRRKRKRNKKGFVSITTVYLESREYVYEYIINRKTMATYNMRNVFKGMPKLVER